MSRPGYYLRWLLNGVVYEFSVMPDANITLTAEWLAMTNLPAMVVDLHDESGAVIPLSSVTKEKYVTSTISITNTQGKSASNSVTANFKGRGNGTWTGDQKSYKIKFDHKQALFAGTANKHWVILGCSMANDLAYNMGKDNIHHARSGLMCLLMVNIVACICCVNRSGLTPGA